MYVHSYIQAINVRTYICEHVHGCSYVCKSVIHKCIILDIILTLPSGKGKDMSKNFSLFCKACLAQKNTAK